MTLTEEMATKRVITMVTKGKQKFRIRLLKHGEELDPDEFLIDYSDEQVLDMDCATVICSRPLFALVLEAKKNGGIPGRIAIVDVGAEDTSAMALAMGIDVPLEVCLAAAFYDRVGPGAVKNPALKSVIKAYYGYLDDQLDGFEEDEEIDDKVLENICWRTVITKLDRIRHFEELFHESKMISRYGVENEKVEDGLCTVYATGWAYPYGFTKAQTVLLAQIDDEAETVHVTIGTIAENATFLGEIHEALCAAEDNRWVLYNDEYLKPIGGTTLSVDAIVEIIRMSLPQHPSCRTAAP